MYDKNAMEDFREAFEERILRFPLVTPKFMFGSPCYLAADSLFAFLVTEGVVLTCLDEPMRNRACAELDARAFESGGKTMRTWMQARAESESDVDRIMPFVQASYEAALAK
jgi:hypothetical protein